MIDAAGLEAQRVYLRQLANMQLRMSDVLAECARTSTGKEADRAARCARKTARDARRTAQAAMDLESVIAGAKK